MSVTSGELGPTGAPQGGGPARRPKGPGLAILFCGLFGFLALPALVGIVVGVRARGRGQLNRAGTIGLGLSIAWLAAGAAVCVPVFLRARESARKVQCLVNTHNLALAMLMYVTDYDDRLPMAHNWSDAIAPYVGDNQKALRCPSAANLRCGYGYNTSLALGLTRWIGASPTDVVTVAEADADWNGPATPERLAPRHMGGGHVGVLDGHARWVPVGGQGKLVWNPFPKPIPPLVVPPPPLVLRHSPAEANALFAGVARGDPLVIPQIRRALATLEPRKQGGIRWAPPLVNVLLQSGRGELEEAAKRWLSDHDMSYLRVRYPDHGVSVSIGCDRDPAEAKDDVAVAYECGPYSLRFSLLRLPEEAYNYPDDPSWHGVSILEVHPRADEEEGASEKRWVAVSETADGWRFTYERPTGSRDWVWASDRQ